MMPLKYNFVTLAELSTAVTRTLPRIPKGVDLVVGIPRSGMIPAYTIGLHLNLPVMSVDAFSANRFEGHGRTRPILKTVDTPLEAKRILLVDDSCYTGNSLYECVASVRQSGYQGEIITFAVIVEPSVKNKVDIWALSVEMPRVFEWNLFHHKVIGDACLDFDGVLCVEPSEKVNDDGERYRDFLLNAPPLYLPSTKVAHIVSARLEKYRPECEAWLKKHGVEYGQLHLLNVATQEERRRTKAHILHKISVYRESGSAMFVESSEWQAVQIAKALGRPVISLETMTLHRGSGIYLEHSPVAMRRLKRSVKEAIKRVLGLLGLGYWD